MWGDFREGFAPEQTLKMYGQQEMTCLSSRVQKFKHSNSILEWENWFSNCQNVCDCNTAYLMYLWLGKSNKMSGQQRLSKVCWIRWVTIQRLIPPSSRKYNASAMWRKNYLMNCITLIIVISVGSKVEWSKLKHV